MFAVYVFLGNPGLLIDLMGAMQTLQLFDQGEYMVIYVDMINYSVKEAAKYLWSKCEKNYFHLGSLYICYLIRTPFISKK